MGNYFQSVVIKDVPLAQAPQLGQQLVTWLVAQNIIKSQTSDCILSAKENGYSPADHYQQAVNDPDDKHFLSLITNGVELHTERTVFHAGQSDFELVCPCCKHKQLGFDDCGDAIESWYQGQSFNPVRCTACGQTQDLLSWQSNYGFGNLGLTFWNWPELTLKFVDQLGQLTNKTTQLVVGKI